MAISEKNESTTPSREPSGPMANQSPKSLGSSSSPRHESLLDSYPYCTTPSTIPGVLHHHNHGAMDWASNGLIAYGCQNKIVIVNGNDSMDYVQTLHRHKHSVCVVKWAASTSNVLLLASADTNGVIIVWNIVDSTPLTAILSTNETKNISSLHWICLDRDQVATSTINSGNLQEYNSSNTYKGNSIRTIFLLAFYQSVNSFILYDAELGEPVVRWQVEYSIGLVTFNPFFHFARACDSSVHNLLFAFKTHTEEKIYIGTARIGESDFSNATSKEVKKLNLTFEVFAMQSGFADSAQRGNRRYDLVTKLDGKKVSQYLMPHLNSSHNPPTSLPNDGIVQLHHHRSVRNQVFIVLPRDIYLVDFTLQTIVSIIPIERNCSKVIQIHSCLHRNAFYAFHESGNVSFRLYQKKVIYDRATSEKSAHLAPSGLASQQQTFLNVAYITLCHSESIRLTKQNKILANAVSPFDETRTAFLLSSGRILIKSLVCQKMIENESNNLCSYILNQSVPLPCLSDLIKPQEYKLGAFLEVDDEDQKPFDSIDYKLIVTHYTSGLNSMPTVLRMCPPVTKRNICQHRPLLAVGDSLGLVQIWLLDGNSTSLHREFSVHSYQIAGIEWTGLDSLISYSYPTMSSPSHHHLGTFTMVTGSGSGSSSGKVTNELVHIDIQTGKASPFRTNSINDSSPIDTIRVSHLKQYVIILFKRDDPFEIWDVKTLTLLKVMSKSLANISAVEWSPIRDKKQTANKMLELTDSDASGSTYIARRENFIVTNRDLFHFSIEGNIVKELARIPLDSESGGVNVTSIAWKRDQVLIGDASGTLNAWDLKRQSSRTESTYHGYIRKIRFGPGQGNMKCLILYANYSVDIWDINEFSVCAQLKYPRDMSFKIIDVDWASSDLPVLCTADGLIFITDLKLKSYSSPITIQPLSDSSINRLLFKVNHRVNTNINFVSFDSKRDLIRRSLFMFPLRESSVEDEEEVSETSQLDVRKYIDYQTLIAKVFANLDDYDFWAIFDSILFGEELDSRLDLFLDENHFRFLQQEKLLLLESNRKTYSQARIAYQLNLRLKNYQRAVQILLETESFLSPSLASEDDVQHSVFYVDALKACLVAALQLNQHQAAETDTEVEASDTSDSQQAPSELNVNEIKVAPVVKLVATNLIANGHILDGVELLNFISKTADSCRYLQSSDQWLDSIWIAKSSLNTNECTEVLRRWCEHLIFSKSYSDQQTVLKMYLSRKQFSRVLRTMNRIGDLKAFPFALMCIVAQLIDVDANRDLLEEVFDKFVHYFVDDCAEVGEMIKATDATAGEQNLCSIDNDCLRNFWQIFHGP